MQQQPTRKSMTSTMTTIALVLTGVLTADASNLRWRGSNSPASPREVAPARAILHETRKANLSDATAFGSFELRENTYENSRLACAACDVHARESAGLAPQQQHMDRKCICMSYPADGQHKMYCAQQKTDDKNDVISGYRATDATNLVAEQGGCLCNYDSGLPTCEAPVAVVGLPRRRRTSFGTGGNPPLHCDETLVGTGENNAGYRGCQTKTRTGKTCQAWSSQTPHTHSTTCARFPEGGICNQPLPNACRNPTNTSDNDGIWCYTVGVERWEACDPRDATADPIFVYNKVE